MKRIAIALLLATACGDDPPNVGGTCTSASNCDVGLTCDTTAVGGYCTQACTTPGSIEGCPEGSICDAVAGTAMACVRICKEGMDCRPDQNCNGITGSDVKACKPKP